MTATPAPYLSGDIDTNGDLIVLTGSGMPLTIEDLSVLDAANRARIGRYRSDITFSNFPVEVRELQRDGLLSMDTTPTITEFGFLALEMAGWV